MRQTAIDKRLTLQVSLLYSLVETIMNPLDHNPYMQDILSQADSVKVALTKFDSTSLEALTQSIQRGDFDRIVLTGMGGSLHNPCAEL